MLNGSKVRLSQKVNNAVSLCADFTKSAKPSTISGAAPDTILRIFY